jgi:mannose-6-phosphate isomerase-like protein (cupin superfamily)
MQMRKVAAIAMMGSVLALGQGFQNSATDKGTYYGEEQLQKIMKSVPGAFSARLFNNNTGSTAFIRLDAPDQPHAHGTWAEVFVIKEGSAVLSLGGKITGDVGTDSATHKSIFIDPATLKPRQQAEGGGRGRGAGTPGDLSGTDVEGSTKQRVGPGDVILIPAGVAHVFVQVDKPVVYLDIKFPKSE